MLFLYLPDQRWSWWNN